MLLILVLPLSVVAEQWIVKAQTNQLASNCQILPLDYLPLSIKQRLLMLTYTSASIPDASVCEGLGKLTDSEDIHWSRRQQSLSLEERSSDALCTLHTTSQKNCLFNVSDNKKKTTTKKQLSHTDQLTVNEIWAWLTSLKEQMFNNYHRGQTSLTLPTRSGCQLNYTKSLQ